MYSPVMDEKNINGNGVATMTFLEEAREISNESSMGGEDAGFFYQKVPGCFFRLYSAAPFTDGEIYPAHSSRFVLDDSVLYRGTALFLQNVFDQLCVTVVK